MTGAAVGASLGRFLVDGSFTLLVHLDRVDVLQVVGEPLVAFESRLADVALEPRFDAALVAVVT